MMGQPAPKMGHQIGKKDINPGSMMGQPAPMMGHQMGK